MKHHLGVDSYMNREIKEFLLKVFTEGKVQTQGTRCRCLYKFPMFLRLHHPSFDGRNLVLSQRAPLAGVPRPHQGPPHQQGAQEGEVHQAVPAETGGGGQGIQVRTVITTYHLSA